MFSRSANFSIMFLGAFLSSSLVSLADECSDKLQKAFSAISETAAVRVVKTMTVDNVDMWADTTEFMPPNIFRRTGKLLVEDSHAGWQKINPISDIPPTKDDPIIIETGKQSYDNGKPRYAEAEMAEDMLNAITDAHLRSLLQDDKITAVSCEADGIHGLLDSFAPVKNFMTDAKDLEKQKADRKAEISAPDYVSELSPIIAIVDDEGRIAGLKVSLDTAALPRPSVVVNYTVTYDDTISIEVPK